MDNFTFESPEMVCCTIFSLSQSCNRLKKTSSNNLFDVLYEDLKNICKTIFNSKYGKEICSEVTNIKYKVSPIFENSRTDFDEFKNEFTELFTDDTYNKLMKCFYNFIVFNYNFKITI